jgi:hypothetical protein
METTVKGERWGILNVTPSWVEHEGQPGVVRIVDHKLTGTRTVQHADGVKLHQVDTEAGWITTSGTGSLRESSSYAAERARRLRPPRVDAVRADLIDARATDGIGIAVELPQGEREGGIRGSILITDRSTARGFVSVWLPEHRDPESHPSLRKWLTGRESIFEQTAPVFIDADRKPESIANSIAAAIRARTDFDVTVSAAGRGYRVSVRDKD